MSTKTKKQQKLKLFFNVQNAIFLNIFFKRRKNSQCKGHISNICLQLYKLTNKEEKKIAKSLGYNHWNYFKLNLSKQYLKKEII